MIPPDQLELGIVIKRYDHGYMVVWNHATDQGLETTDDSYVRVHELCPSPGHLLGSLVVYASAGDGRTIKWLTAFSKEQLSLLVSKFQNRSSEKLESSVAAIMAINEVLAASFRKSIEDRRYKDPSGEERLSLDVFPLDDEIFLARRIEAIESFIAGKNS